MNTSRHLRILAVAAVAILAIFRCGTGGKGAGNGAFFVAPDGDDESPGSKKRPFMTVSRALEAVRSLPPEKAGKIVLRGGTYYDTRIDLTEKDSGLTIEAAPGETPVLYGGHPVTNWVREGDFLTAELAGVREGTWDFRAFIVNGEMRQRARLPETGAFTHLSEFKVRWMSSTGGGWERKPTEEELTTMIYKPGDLGPWLDTNNAELTIFHAWDESVVGVRSIDDRTHTITFSIPSGHPPGGFGDWMEKARTYVVWNIREGMRNPGQWYLDRTAGKLVYWPLPGEDIDTIIAIVPTAETIVRLESGIHDITLNGLALSSTTTPLITGGFGALRFDGAVSGRKLSRCRFTNLIVRNVGGWGIKASGDSLTIEGCIVENTGAGGISFNGMNVTVNNNLIHRIGIIYPSALALQGGGTDCRISHNEIHETPYSAINCGGLRTIIEYNLIYDMMQVLNDGGAIYCFAPEELIMRGNVVRGASGTRAHAYYLDERAENCVVENNLAVDTTWPVHNHMTKNCIIRNNVFIDSGHQLLTFPRTSGMKFERNILIADDITFEAPTASSAKTPLPKNVPEAVKPFLNANGITEMPNNIVYSRTGTVNHKIIGDYSTIKTVPMEPLDGTLYTDPLLSDWEKGDYSFRQDSPAHALGITPIDVSTAGRLKTPVTKTKK